MEQVKETVTSMLRPQVILDLLENFTSYVTQKGKQRIKIIARYQQYEGANKLVERVVAGHPKKGLIWHFQGSGKSLLMLFAARKLRLHPALKNPTVVVVVDRIDLDSQISSTFYAASAANLVKAESRKDLRELLEKDVRKIIITTIHKFGEAVCSTSATTSLCWWTRHTARRRATWGARCAMLCPMRSSLA